MFRLIKQQQNRNRNRGHGSQSKAIDRHQGMHSAYLHAFHGIPLAFKKHGCGTFPSD